MTCLCKGIPFPIKTNRLLRHNSIYESQNPYSACKKLHRKICIYAFDYMTSKKRKNNP